MKNNFLQKILIFFIIAFAVIAFNKAFASAAVIIIPESETTINQPDSSFNPDWNVSVEASSSYLSSIGYSSSWSWFFCSSGDAVDSPSCGGPNSSASMLTGGVPWYSANPTAIRANNISQVGTSGQPYYSCYVNTDYYCFPLQNNSGTVSYLDSTPLGTPTVIESNFVRPYDRSIFAYGLGTNEIVNIPVSLHLKVYNPLPPAGAYQYMRVAVQQYNENNEVIKTLLQFSPMGYNSVGNSTDYYFDFGLEEYYLYDVTAVACEGDSTTTCTGPIFLSGPSTVFITGGTYNPGNDSTSAIISSIFAGIPTSDDYECSLDFSTNIGNALIECLKKFSAFLLLPSSSVKLQLTEMYNEYKSNVLYTPILLLESILGANKNLYMELPFFTGTVVLDNGQPFSPVADHYAAILLKLTFFSLWIWFFIRKIFF